jgi:hypothetical protein
MLSAPTPRQQSSIENVTAIVANVRQEIFKREIRAAAAASDGNSSDGDIDTDAWLDDTW